MPYLPDVNVLLALVFEVHQHHRSAAEWVQDAEECHVCRITQSGLLQLSTNSSLLKEEALTLAEAWSVYDTLMEDERFVFSREPLGTEHYWRRLTTVEQYSPKVWTDRYLAAFAIAGSMTLVTFDGAAAAHPDLDALVLRAQ